MRQIYEVNAHQVVVSESHPEGVYSTVAGYPKAYDSRSYETSEENPDGSDAIALIVAKAEFADTVKQLSLANNRAMWSVTLARADGRQLMHESFGAMPTVTQTPDVGGVELESS